MTVNDIRFLNQPTKTNRQLVAIDITHNATDYNWVIYAPLVSGEAMSDYITMVTNIITADIDRKEAVWVTHPKTEEIADPFTGETKTVDIPKDRVVRPTIPDYIEGLAEQKSGSELQTILDELGTAYWQYPQFAKRIIAPQELIFDDNGIKMYGWFNIQGFPIIKIGVQLHLYCNVILPEHQAMVDSFGGALTIEDRP
jgi:hypothetical protein